MARVTKKAAVLSGLVTGSLFLTALASYLALFPAGYWTAERSFEVDSFTVETRIHNGTVTSVQYSEYGELVVGIRAHDHGRLQILIPAGMVDTCREDLPFAGYVVWVENEEAGYEVIELSIPRTFSPFLAENEEAGYEEAEPDLLGIEFASDARRIEIAGICYLS